MTAAQFDISIEQGATWRRTFIWRQPGPDENTPGDPYDLTNCTALLQVRTVKGAEDALLTLTDPSGEAGGINLGTDDGRFTITLSAPRTRALTVKKAVYDLFITFPGGDVRRPLEGKVLNDLAVSVPPS